MIQDADHANAEAMQPPARSTAGYLLPNTCSAPISLLVGGAMARQGGDSKDEPLPGLKSGGVIPGPEAGTAANLASSRSVAPSRGARAREEQRGRSIIGLRFSQPQTWAARARFSYSWLALRGIRTPRVSRGGSLSTPGAPS